MDIDADINWTTKKLRSTSDPSMITLIKNLLSENFEAHSVDTLSLAHYNQKLILAEKSTKEDHGYSLNQVKEEVKRWRKR
ncbi:hypothetical protein GCM10009117_21860 [Gangjinia marincola]|uniref:Uncharacterized protein n=1 Tax=Gangjinia marincola TaxID=578463 RepID=A0ABP3XYW0_9FLAO